MACCTRRVRWLRKRAPSPAGDHYHHQLLRAVDDRSVRPRHRGRQELEGTRNDGTRILQNAEAAPHKEHDPT